MSLPLPLDFDFELKDLLHADDYTPASTFEYHAEEDDFYYFGDDQDDDQVVQELALLPHQLALMSDTTSKIIGMVSGFGAGKTYIAARKALQLAALNPGCDGIITEPNFPLLAQILIPEVHAALREFGLSYTYKATENIFYVEIGDKVTRIICKSMEKYDRLIGINAAWIILDEFDTAKADVAYQAFLKLLGRLRAGTTRQLIITTTPEGFGAAYKIFIEEELGTLIKAKTTDNIFLPDDFIQTMYDIYPERLVDAYINGEFVNMSSFTVFDYFDREKNHATIKMTDSDKDVWLGGDFNAGGCVTLSALVEDNKVYVFGENLAKDTFETGHYLSASYRDKHLYGCFDATGNKKTSNASQSDLDILADSGVSLMMGQSNPHMNDSILSVNNALRHRELFIDTKKCPELTKALEQLSWDEVTGKPEKFSGPGTIDDYTDSLRYLIWVLKPVTKITFSTYNSIGVQTR